MPNYEQQIQEYRNALDGDDRPRRRLPSKWDEPMLHPPPPFNSARQVTRDAGIEKEKS